MIYAVSVTKWQKEQWKIGELDVVAYVHDNPKKLRIFKNLEELIEAQDYGDKDWCQRFIRIAQSQCPERLAKGDQLSYLGYTIEMCTNNDGIVLLSPEGSHLGNFGVNVAYAKKDALINFMLDVPQLRPSIVNRLHRASSGTVGDYTILKRAIEERGLELPIDLKIDQLNRMIIL
jgi:hypothetical protein